MITQSCSLMNANNAFFTPKYVYHEEHIPDDVAPFSLFFFLSSLLKRKQTNLLPLSKHGSEIIYFLSREKSEEPNNSI